MKSKLLPYTVTGSLLALLISMPILKPIFILQVVLVAIVVVFIALVVAHL